MPSTRRTIASNAPATSSPSSNPGCAHDWLDRQKAGPRRTPPSRRLGLCMDNAGTGHTSSPSTSSGERLVARTVTNGHRATAPRPHPGPHPGRARSSPAPPARAHAGTRPPLAAESGWTRADRFEHRAVDQAGVGQRSQLDEVDVRPAQVAGADAQLQGQPGLADPAGPTRVTSRLPSRNSDRSWSSSTFPANEAGQGHRQVAGDIHVLRAAETGTPRIRCLPHAKESWHAREPAAGTVARPGIRQRPSALRWSREVRQAPCQREVAH